MSVARSTTYRSCCLLVLALTGSGACSKEVGFALPTPSATSVEASASPRDAVLGTYSGYWEVSPKAAKLPTEQARPLLEPFMMPGPLKAELEGAAEWQRKHWEPWGQAQIHVTD